MHTFAGRRVALGCWVVGVLSSGCGVTEDPAAAEEGVDAITVREGDYNLQSANGGGQPYTDIAVIGSRGFLAKGYEGLHVLDLRTMRVSQRLWEDRNRKRIPADALQVIGRNQILATWQGNRLGDLDDDRQYVFLNVFNTTSLTVTRTVAIDLTGTYEGTNGLNQLPNVATHLDTASNTLWIAFGHLDPPRPRSTPPRCPARAPSCASARSLGWRPTASAKMSKSVSPLVRKRPPGWSMATRCVGSGALSLTQPPRHSGWSAGTVSPGLHASVTVSMCGEIHESPTPRSMRTNFAGCTEGELAVEHHVRRVGGEPVEVHLAPGWQVPSALRTLEGQPGRASARLVDDPRAS
jgi:hypothetical protein